MTDAPEQVSEFKHNGPSTIEDRKREARAVIPVSRGVRAGDYADYITVAQDICKPDNIMLRPELRSNVPVIVGLLDVADRAGMSVYMLATKCYVIKGVLCFESQVFHALAKPFLEGALKGDYSGEGMERRLTVRGRLRGDPYEYPHESPKLEQLHPGHKTVEINGQRVSQPKGSPLWDRKPDMQLWYDTTRDWIRKFCPEAVLGVYTLDEVVADDFKDVTPRPSLGERLAANERPTPLMREGFNPEAVEESLAAAEVVDAETGEVLPAPAPQEAAGRRKRPAKGSGKPPRAKPAQKPPQAQREAPAKKAKVAEPAAPKEPVAPKENPRARAYVEETRAWIAAATDPAAAAERWEEEYQQRNDLDVRIADRNALRAMLEERVEQLRGGR